MLHRRNRIHKRFLQLGKSHYRLSDAHAEQLASLVSGTLDRLLAFETFRSAPLLREPSVNAGIIRRWTATIPDYLAIAIVIQHRVQPHPVLRLPDAQRAAIHEAANQVAMQEYQMHPLDASEFANCIEKAASPAHAFHNACVADRMPLKEIAGFLRAYLEGAAPFAAAAMCLMERNVLGNPQSGASGSAV